jgi:hypothetical protein
LVVLASFSVLELPALQVDFSSGPPEDTLWYTKGTVVAVDVVMPTLWRAGIRHLSSVACEKL